MDGDGVRRPPVDVVVPFAGTAEELDQLLGRLSALRLGGGTRLGWTTWLRSKAADEDATNWRRVMRGDTESMFLP